MYARPSRATHYQLIFGQEETTLFSEDLPIGEQQACLLDGSDAKKYNDDINLILQLKEVTNYYSHHTVVAFSVICRRLFIIITSLACFIGRLAYHEWTKSFVMNVF